MAQTRQAGLALVLVVLAGTTAADSPEELERRALAAMGEGHYAAVEELLQQVAAALPNSPRVLYNLACCASRLGDTGKAAERLEAAWRAGFDDLDLVRTDPDLEALRGSVVGRRLLGRLEREATERRRRRGDTLLFDASVLASGRVLAPERVAAGRRLPLLVALHGNGGTAEAMVGLLAAADLSPDLVLCAPTGSYPVLTEEGLGRSWYPPSELFKELTTTSADGGTVAERRTALASREQEAAERLVLAAVDAVTREQPVDRNAVFLLGHSQGGVLAYGLALAYPERFRGLVVVGGRLREEDSTPHRLARAAGRLRVLVCHSPEDQAVDFAEGRSAARRLAAAGVETRLVRYAGGHGFTVELVRRVVEWIAETAAGRPPRTPAEKAGPGQQPVETLSPDPVPDRAGGGS